MNPDILLKLLLVAAAGSAGLLSSCSDEEDANNNNDEVSSARDAADAADAADADTNEDADTPRVGFEILQILSLNEIIVWINTDMTREQFDAIELPQGWFKNEPREGDPDGGAFARSPDASADGEYTDQEHFGHLWRHNATVIEANILLDEEGLLRLTRVAKFHEIRFDAGRTLFVLVSPEGERFVRISRDADRTSEVPTLPSNWQLVEHVIAEELVFDLPNPTLNIRCDNEDSFQGPVTELEGL